MQRGDETPTKTPQFWSHHAKEAADVLKKIIKGGNTMKTKRAKSDVLVCLLFNEQTENSKNFVFFSSNKN